jgi:hypothetical protein
MIGPKNIAGAIDQNDMRITINRGSLHETVMRGQSDKFNSAARFTRVKAVMTARQKVSQEKG